MSYVSSGKSIGNKSDTMNTSLYLGNAFEHMNLMLDNSVDAIITDPPYDGVDWVNFILEANRICRGNIVVFCKPENQPPGPSEYLFWVKTPSTKNFKNACGRFVEIICVYKKGTFNQLHWSQMTGVYDDRLIVKPVHPYEKPLSLIERLARIYTNPGDTIYDPFMGSGTTGEASVHLGRNFIGGEIDPVYFSLAERRILNANAIKILS
jgi:DNA modification methylase